MKPAGDTNLQRPSSADGTSQQPQAQQHQNTYTHNKLSQLQPAVLCIMYLVAFK